MGWNDYGRIEYKKCKVFNDGYGGIRTTEKNREGKNVVCCRGALTDKSEWASVCDECYKCPKYIRTVLGEIEEYG